jgi:hypothetical protein
VARLGDRRNYRDVVFHFEPGADQISGFHVLGEGARLHLVGHRHGHHVAGNLLVLHEHFLLVAVHGQHLSFQFVVRGVVAGADGKEAHEGKSPKRHIHSL